MLCSLQHEFCSLRFSRNSFSQLSSSNHLQRTPSCSHQLQLLMFGARSTRPSHPKLSLLLLICCPRRNPMALCVHLHLQRGDCQEDGLLSTCKFNFHLFFFQMFFPYVYDVKSQVLLKRHPSNLIITHWRRNTQSILPCIDNSLSVHKKERDY